MLRTNKMKWKGFLLKNSLLNDLVESYNYFNKVVNGLLGTTAAYWSTYIYMISSVYMELQHSIRPNDVDLYILVLPILFDIFFALNWPNYARWGSLFLHKLRSLDVECRKILNTGAFSLLRVGKNHTRMAIEICLEQL